MYAYGPEVMSSSWCIIVVNTKGVLAPGSRNAAERRGYAAEDGERESEDGEKT
jgi:hypothetical protein